MHVAFVSDITCPWCAIGLAGLECAIARLKPDVVVELHLEPFELNPDLPSEGEDIADYVARKYGASAGQLAERQALIIARGAEAGWRFIPRTRIWNTFDAHRLLAWAATQQHELPLKRALLAAYHEHGENPASHEILLGCAAVVGLDLESARTILEGDAYAREVRARVRHWQARGLSSVPSVVVADSYLLQGGLTAGDYERALSHVAGQAARAKARAPIATRA